MKRPYSILIFLALWGAAVFGQEEIDFLLFLPNSSNQFVNEDQAMIQLDKVANYLAARDLVSGQISIYGYAANVENNIDPMDLSRDRALFVMNELQKRGLSRSLFAEPLGHGSVDLWGSNTDEADRSPNRRVRILVEGIILTPAIVQSVEPETAAPPVAVQDEEPMQHEKIADESHSPFPWWILLLPLLLIPFLFLASKRAKSAAAKTIPKTPPSPPPVPAKKIVKPITVPEIIQARQQAPTTPGTKVKVLEEDEIRRFSYKLYEQRNGQHGYDADDWYNAIRELTAYYEASGHRIILYWQVSEQ